ncbi:restriction endonuclease subunit S [Heyndrickxia coagulans]|uniref:restriction endonuclease subunit S n=1 Tax=Heyndrickxia coagulans TaxID=1398 RepID=UPI001A93ADC2|nr:restriction endonuclease subunit S [Heyndrickxia coagulans]
METYETDQKSSYKKTPIGLLPDDWKVAKLGKYIKIYSGDSPSNVEFNDNGIPYYKVDDLNNSSKFITESKLKVNKHSIKKVVPPKSLIFPKRGASILTNKVRILTEESYFDTNIMGVEVNEKEVDFEYLYYFITKRGLYKIADISAIPQLNNKHIEPLLFPKPILKEQQKIASILSTWDKAIELKEKLIEQKKQQKKGLMQKLLTGNIRFPGFRDTWKKKKIGDLLVESKEVVKVPDLNRRITVRLNLKGVQKREITTVEKADATTQYLRKAGQFIYGKQNLHKGAFGIIPEELDGYESSSDIPSFDFKEGVDRYWFYYYFSREVFYSNLEKISTGTGSKRIHPKDLFKVKILFPSYEEQQKIAEILKCIDNEINLLKDELEVLKQQKKGLMQLLLTGKVRVKV